MITASGDVLVEPSDSHPITRLSPAAVCVRGSGISGLCASQTHDRCSKYDKDTGASRFSTSTSAGRSIGPASRAKRTGQSLRLLSSLSSRRQRGSEPRLFLCPAHLQGRITSPPSPKCCGIAPTIPTNSAAQTQVMARPACATSVLPHVGEVRQGHFCASSRIIPSPAFRQWKQHVERASPPPASQWSMYLLRCFRTDLKKHGASPPFVSRLRVTAQIVGGPDSYRGA